MESNYVDKWDRRFLDLARHISEWSKDPSTKVGAVIVRGKRIISMGYNGFPIGLPDGEELYANREYKYDHIIHGEMNAILFAKESLTNATLYTWPFMPCIRCAAVIAQVGFARVVAPYSDNPRWIESFKKTEELFKQANPVIELILVK